MPTGFFGWQKDVLKHDVNIENGQFLGKYFPECQFISINRSLDHDYLGIKEPFKKIQLTEIKSSFIYVALFNEMCLQCVEEMKQYGQLFRRFKQDKKFSKSVKIIGIGAGSTNRSAKKFASQHNIPFPIFADKNWNVFKCLGEPPLPVSYLLKKESDTRLKIELIHESHIQNVSDIMKEISSFIY
jgi:peroxiredoxin